MKYFALILALTASMMFTGCGEKESAETQSETTVQQADGSTAEVQTDTEVTTETTN